MDTDIIHYSCKNRGYYEDIDKDFETKIDTSNFELDKALPKGKHQKVIGLVADELGGQIMIEFVALRAKTNSYLKDNNDEDKMVRGTKKSVTKRKLKFQDYKNFLEPAQNGIKINDLEKNKFNVDSPKEHQKEFIKNNKLILKTQQRFRSEKYNVFTKEINKIALSSNDDKKCNRLM